MEGANDDRLPATAARQLLPWTVDASNDMLIMGGAKLSMPLVE